MSNAKPVFDFNQNNLGAESDQAVVDATAQRSKYFDEPGNFDLTIVSAEYNVGKETGTIYAKGDSSWIVVKLLVQDAAGREMREFLLVPTGKATYGEKGTLQVYRKYAEFMGAIGDPVSIDEGTLGPITKKYFSDLKKLVGKKLNADLDFEGDFVRRNEAGEFEIVAKGQALPETFPDRAAAKQYAESQGIQLSYLRIARYHGAKRVLKPAKAASTDW